MDSRVPLEGGTSTTHPVAGKAHGRVYVVEPCLGPSFQRLQSVCLRLTTCMLFFRAVSAWFLHSRPPGLDDHVLEFCIGCSRALGYNTLERRQLFFNKLVFYVIGAEYHLPSCAPKNKATVLVGTRLI